MPPTLPSCWRLPPHPSTRPRGCSDPWRGRTTPTRDRGGACRRAEYVDLGTVADSFLDRFGSHPRELLQYRVIRRIRRHVVRWRDEPRLRREQALKTWNRAAHGGLEKNTAWATLFGAEDNAVLAHVRLRISSRIFHNYTFRFFLAVTAATFLFAAFFSFAATFFSIAFLVRITVFSNPTKRRRSCVRVNFRRRCRT